MTTHSMEEVDALASRVGIIASKMLGEPVDQLIIKPSLIFVQPLERPQDSSHALQHMKSIS